MRRLIATAVAAALISGCAATGPVAYGPADAKGFGYEDTKIESDRFRVVYNGSGGMPPEQVEDYALLRAAELARENGFDWFRIVGRDIARDRRGGVSLGAGVGGGNIGRRSSVGVGVGGNFGQVGAQDYFSVRMELLMGNDPMPDEPDVYRAESILTELGALLAPAS